MKSSSLNFVATLILAALILLPSDFGFAAEKQKLVKVLLITGDDVSPAHNWKEISQAVRETLESTGNFEVRVSEDPAILESAGALSRYDVVFLQFYNAKSPTLNDAAKENLSRFISGGKGMVVSHLSSASFKEWDEFKKMCGRYWVMGKSGHGPRSTFKVKVANTDHPITSGLSDFEADDELYAKLQGDGQINVLVTADSDWSKQTEPLVFLVNYGNGRVFNQAFGHDGKAVRNPAVQTLIQRGTAWAATGKLQ